MHSKSLNLEHIEDKTNLLQKANLISSTLSLAFALVCYFALNINQIVPQTLALFGFLAITNNLLFKYHKNPKLLFNIAAISAFVAAITISLFTGGINSSFIFSIPLIVFSGYVKKPSFNIKYLILIICSVALLFSQAIPSLTFTKNIIPVDSQIFFSLGSIIFFALLLGPVLGDKFIKNQHDLYKDKADLSRKLLEKETLLKEIHHRVKNNLQTVSSLLSMQSRNVSEERTKAYLKNTQNRVISMAMIHEMLYMRNDLSNIEYKTYVQELSQYLIKSIKGIENKIKLTIDIADIKLGIDTAIPLGLLINETITNALKYGIVDDTAGEIHIAIKKEIGKGYELKIGDNGIGYAENINYRTTKSLGLKLIHSLTKQLKGSVSRDSSKKGTNYIIKFYEIGQLHPTL